MLKCRKPLKTIKGALTRSTDQFDFQISIKEIYAIGIY